MLKFFYAIAMVAVCNFAVASPEKPEPLPCAVRGEITQKRVANFIALVEKGACSRIDITSPGGDMDAAMAMGRAIRSAQLPVQTSNPGCMSACVLIYAAGVERAPYGVVAIHRPYYLDTGGSMSQTADRYRLLETRVKNYLRDMNVSPNLFDRMMRIPPEEMHKMTMDEMEGYEMGISDPVYMEYIAGKMAKKFGMNRLEYLDRMRVVKQNCGNPHNFSSEDKLKLIAECWNREWPGYLDSL